MFIEINIYGNKTRFRKEDENIVRREYSKHCGTYDDLMFILEDYGVFEIQDTDEDYNRYNT